MGNATVTLLILTELFWINLIQLKGKSAPARLSVQEPKLATKRRWFMMASVNHWHKQSNVRMASAAATAPAKCSLCHHIARAARKQMGRKE